ncbi:MAG TPA: flippase [Lacunisphaera sp.]|nr:flippase [Lacunisphaera sp.]
MNASAWLPPFLARRLAGRDTLRRSIDNVSWLFADQLIRMVAGLLVGVWMARHLGPEQYGWLSYAIAVVGTVGALTALGLNAVVVRELVRAPAATEPWLGAAFFLKSVGAGLGFLICVGVAWLQPAGTTPVRPLVIIVALGLFFQALDVYDLLFQSRGRSRVSAYVRIAACVLANLVKVGLILGGASLLLLAAAGVLELALCAAGWMWAGRKSTPNGGRFRMDRDCVRTLLRDGWPLALSGLAVHTQAYADQLVLGAMLGGGELGQYAAAMRLVGVFAFIPMVVQTVTAPEITRAKQDDERLYRRRLHSFYRLMFGLFLLTAVPLVVFGPLATRLLFGPAYAGAAALLPWLAFRLFFTNLGVARSLFITNEGLFRFALVTALAGAAANLALNLLLVPWWGARGAIVSSFVSFGLTTFALEAFHPRARENLRLMARAIFLPWRPLPS